MHSNVSMPGFKNSAVHSWNSWAEFFFPYLRSSHAWMHHKQVSASLWATTLKNASQQLHSVSATHGGDYHQPPVALSINSLQPRSQSIMWSDSNVWIHVSSISIRRFLYLLAKLIQLKETASIVPTKQILFMDIYDDSWAGGWLWRWETI